MSLHVCELAVCVFGYDRDLFDRGTVQCVADRIPSWLESREVGERVSAVRNRQAFLVAIVLANSGCWPMMRPVMRERSLRAVGVEV